MTRYNNCFPSALCQIKISKKEGFKKKENRYFFPRNLKFVISFSMDNIPEHRLSNWQQFKTSVLALAVQPVEGWAQQAVVHGESADQTLAGHLSSAQHATAAAGGAHRCFAALSFPRH